MYPGRQGGDDGRTAPAQKQAKVTSDTSDQILTHFTQNLKYFSLKLNLNIVTVTFYGDLVVGRLC